MRKEDLADAKLRLGNDLSGPIDSYGFLESGIIDPVALGKARQLAKDQNTSLLTVIISQNLLAPEKLVTEMARTNGLRALCLPEDLSRYDIVEQQYAGFLKANDQPSGLVLLQRDGWIYTGLDPLSYSRDELDLIFAHPPSGGRVILLTPALRERVQDRLKGGEADTRRLHRATNGLGLLHKGFSAREGMNYAQRLGLSFLAGLLIGGFILSPITTLYGVGALLNLVFLYTILLRFGAIGVLWSAGAENLDRKVIRVHDEDLPVYTVLVPLFREHRIVGQLIENLMALDYPRDRLDIKLIFEQEDALTVEAARACNPPSFFEFVIVPQSMPQTKPKALNYALETALGRYVVVFDAEDLPDPDQLRKAVAVFRAGDGELACLQARLNYYNGDENWLARQFTIEYTSLFDGFLPALQNFHLPILLGGTSNHFRTSVLRQLGGWDAYNVTEDADLGIRLARFGYRCEMLASTTYEEACCRPRDWLHQRTRWLKGWLQTYIVHMRNPGRLQRQLGLREFFGFQIILGAQVLSLIVHPIYILFMGYEFWRGALFVFPLGPLGFLFWGLALANIIFSYVVSIWLGYVTLRRRGLGRLVSQLLFMPLYWLLISLATFRALTHYVFRPFHWEKTEHGLGKSQKPK